MISRKLHLLLIDENDADRQLSQLVIANSLPNCRLTHVDNGNDIFQAAACGPYDLVISQLGIEQTRWSFLLKTIRAVLPETPIVVFARVGEEAEAQVAVESGVAATFAIKSAQGFLDLPTAVLTTVEQHAAHPEFSRSEPWPDESAAMPSPMVDSAPAKSSATSSPSPMLVPPKDFELLNDFERFDQPDPFPRPDSFKRPDPAARPDSIEPPGSPALADSIALSDSIAFPADSTALSDPIGPPEQEAPTETLQEPLSSELDEQIESIYEFRQTIDDGLTEQRPAATIPRKARTLLIVVAALAALFFTFSRLSDDDSGSTADSRGSNVEAPVAAPPEVAEVEEVDEVVPGDPSPDGSPPAPPAAAETPGSLDIRSAQEPMQKPTLGTESLSPIRLELRAIDEVWVALTVDGVPVLDVILQEGQAYSFEAQDSAYLQVGNAAGLSVLWNGQELGSLGRQGQVRRLRFSPEDVLPGAPDSPSP